MVLQRGNSPKDNTTGLKPVKLRKASRYQRFEYGYSERKIENFIRLNLQFASHEGVNRCYNVSIN